MLDGGRIRMPHPAFDCHPSGAVSGKIIVRHWKAAKHAKKDKKHHYQDEAEVQQLDSPDQVTSTKAEEEVDAAAEIVGADAIGTAQEKHTPNAEEGSAEEHEKNPLATPARESPSNASAENEDNEKDEAQNLAQEAAERKAEEERAREAAAKEEEARKAAEEERLAQEAAERKAEEERAREAAAKEEEARKAAEEERLAQEAAERKAEEEGTCQRGCS